MRDSMMCTDRDALGYAVYIEHNTRQIELTELFVRNYGSAFQLRTAHVCVVLLFAGCTLLFVGHLSDAGATAHSSSPSSTSQ